VSNILLVEPDYRSKFPPLGLMKISTYHKRKGDQVTFIRGQDESLRNIQWHRIYVSSLFTWKLPRTVKTIRFYSSAVSSPEDIFVGGIGATLLPDYVRQNAECTLIEGQIEKRGMLGRNSPPITQLTPDYSILDSVDYNYYPDDSYFVRITQGCIRSCKFCAVPLLEKQFGELTDVGKQVREAKNKYGERQHLVIMDNNILGIDGIDKKINRIRALGFENGAKRNGRKRAVDFNQGLDARLISKNPRLAKALASICLSPVRLAFDFAKPAMEKSYRRAISLLAEQGFSQYTNYMLFNYNDTPKDLYHRLFVNDELNTDLGIRITGFPMRFIPMDSVRRDYVSRKWNWRYLRGIQCILLATRGLVSPNPDFIRAAFGDTYERFLEIIAMPDRYIIYREKYKNNGAKEWRKKFRRLSPDRKQKFLSLLAVLNKDRKRKETIRKLKRFNSLIEHYYPNGETPTITPNK